MTCDVLRHLRKIYDDDDDDDDKNVSKKRSCTLQNSAFAMLLARINRIITRHSDDPLKKFICKINNIGSDLLWFAQNPNIQPTNNAAERRLRKIAVHRKVRGGIMAEETMA